MERIDFEAEFKRLTESGIGDGYKDNLATPEAQAAWIAEKNRQQDLMLERHKRKKKLSYLDIKSEVDVYLAKLPCDLEDRMGNCYKYACDFVIQHFHYFRGETLNLIHGYIIFNDDGVINKYCHAWVAINGYLYDPVFNTIQAKNAKPGKGEPRYQPAYKFKPKDASARFIAESGHSFWGERDDDVFDAERFAQHYYNMSNSELREHFLREREQEKQQAAV